ncbi:MAG TPA: alpha/beta hydrolase [Candidatus Polarisedimenticolaceae bacterium]|nr:alpha/beta hydrolase [Candidatus Polarisedimenticolaceae bacterium]
MFLAFLLLAAQSLVPRFEPGACAIEIPEAEREHARCGDLVVAENRQRETGRVIRLPIIILKSASATPAPDPVLRTLGGPGASSLRLVRGRPASPWLQDRDLIVFEQRGTAHAQPHLACPEVDAAKAEGAPPKRVLAAARTCHDRLIEEGVDLGAYDSVQSAADIEDLRQVLGYATWNLYGVSYSARLMLEVMRDHPAGIRSVVLESVLPPDANYDESGVANAVRALEVLFARCAADAACAQAYPRLDEVFYGLFRRANEHPIPVETTSLNGSDIANWVLDDLLSGGPDKIVAAPGLIFQVAQGDASPLREYAQNKLAPGGAFMLGMRYSVWCREEMPFESRRSIARQGRRYPQLDGFEASSLPAICSVWKVPPAQRRANEPVTSEIPTLILGAEYDAYTPPAWGRQAARTLTHGYFYEVPGVGHGPGFVSGCAIRVVTNFLANPTAAPYHQCLESPPPAFLTAGAPPP